jgi:hypothetical protein
MLAVTPFVDAPIPEGAKLADAILNVTPPPAATGAYTHKTRPRRRWSSPTTPTGSTPTGAGLSRSPSRSVEDSSSTRINRQGALVLARYLEELIAMSNRPSPGSPRHWLVRAELSVHEVPRQTSGYHGCPKLPHEELHLLLTQKCPIPAGHRHSLGRSFSPETVHNHSTTFDEGSLLLWIVKRPWRVAPWCGQVVGRRRFRRRGQRPSRCKVQSRAKIFSH